MLHVSGSGLCWFHTRSGHVASICSPMATCWNIARLRSNPRPTHQETDIAAFREAFTERARSVRASLAEGQAKRRRTGARQVLPDGDITQAEAKTMLPPNTSIWRDRTRQGWCAHPSGHSRLSSLWASSGGEQQALRSVSRTPFRG